MTAPDIRVEGLVKRYRSGGRPAVNGMDLQVMPGEFFGLLGPNGAGKTTMISILTGVLAPSEGRRAGARPRRGEGARPRAPPHRLRAAGDRPLRHLTAPENLRYFGRLHGLSTAVLGERAEALLPHRLQDRADEQVRHWSGGMRRRLNIVAALLHEPHPFPGRTHRGHRYPEPRRHLGPAVAGERRLPPCQYTSHHLDEAERLCTRVVVMDDGRSVGELCTARGGGGERLEDAVLRLTGRELRD
ncbi:MAG: ABC transporter ATP-binding protein [Flavobacteriales bacterium]|nr:ABC transporter ATP-binding protein [Flavobacteriales bacterium]